jgi:hypothetical protein
MTTPTTIEGLRHDVAEVYHDETEPGEAADSAIDGLSPRALIQVFASMSDRELSRYFEHTTANAVMRERLHALLTCDY